QSGGSMSVQSQPAAGTTFKIFLPRAHANGHVPIAASSGPEDTLRGSETLLLVEDEDAVRESEREFLQHCGYTVLSARSGPEALECARQCQKEIQLLLTDVVMPKMNGRELAEHLERERLGIKVLYVSGYAEATIVHTVSQT